MNNLIKSILLWVVFLAILVGTVALTVVSFVISIPAMILLALYAIYLASVQKT